MKSSGQPGEVIALHKGRAVGVVTGEGYLELCHLQLEGKQEMTAVEFARGQREFIGSVLG
jgi:methionyl-tRNA formyltransferase